MNFCEVSKPVAIKSLGDGILNFLIRLKPAEPREVLEINKDNFDELARDAENYRVKQIKIERVVTYGNVSIKAEAVKESEFIEAENTERVNDESARNLFSGCLCDILKFVSPKDIGEKITVYNLTDIR